jgi:2-dehydropantoate 2-reductase
VLIVAVKSQDTLRLVEQLAAVPVDGSLSDIPVFCAQNGIANEHIALRFFARVYGVCVSVPATHLEPGVVEAPGEPVSGALQLGRYPDGSDDLCHAVVADLRRSGFRADVQTDAMAWKRAKLISNLANALQVLCVGGFEWGDRTDPVREVASRLAAEASACYAAAGWTVIDGAQFRADAGGFRIAAVNGQARRGGSTWQSVERGLASVETDFLNGEIVRLGRLFGIPTPVNAAVQARMREIALRSLAPSTLQAADLLGP